MLSPYGFTGEQTDGNGQVYLRARYYNPSIGVFNALDPFEASVGRPMSLNGYSWVESNPVMDVVGEPAFHNRYSYANGSPTNYVDHSGMIPERDKITNDNFEYTYSCDCGWIDWKHANPQITAISVLSFVEEALQYLEGHPGSTVAIDGWG